MYSILIISIIVICLSNKITSLVKMKTDFSMAIIFRISNTKINVEYLKRVFSIFNTFYSRKQSVMINNFDRRGFVNIIHDFVEFSRPSYP